MVSKIETIDIDIINQYDSKKITILNKSITSLIDKLKSLIKNES
jgi:hypothetical protein